MPIQRDGPNKLTLEVYANFSTTRVPDTDGDLVRAQNIHFETQYPGGLYSLFTCTIYRDPNRSWTFKPGQRLVVRNGLAIVWEGAIISPGYFADATTGGRILTAYGFWGVGLLGSTGLRKPWADTRITASAWVEQPEATGIVGPAKCSIDRLSRIKFVPKSIQWNNTELAAVRYTAPTGQLIRRIKLSYDFSEAASQPPSIVVYFSAAGASYTDEANAYDGSASTGVTIAAFITTDFLYVGMTKGDIDKINPGSTVNLAVTMGTTKNAIVSTLTAEYWSDNAGAWTALAITDGTATGGKTLAQNGTITYTQPGDIGTKPIADANKTSKHWVRFKVSVNLTANINLNEITYGTTQTWTFNIYDVTSATYTDSVAATGTGSWDRTFAVPSQSVDLRFIAGAQQQPFSNGTVYASVTNLIVYADANAITASEIVTDWVSNVANLNADTSQIATNALSVEPWITGNNVDFEMAASNLARLAALGDASFNAWAVYLLDSESTATPSGKPVLAYQQQPALSDYDYAISLDASTLVSLALAQTPIYNDIIVSYTDVNGVPQWVTSADDAALTDTTAGYGTYQFTLQSGNATPYALAVAKNLGKRFLAQNKDPHFFVNGSIPVTGYILGKNGNPVPASEVRAGKRIKILNFLSDEVGVSGAGLTFVITRTSYDDTTETVNIDCGVPNDLAVLLARIAAFPGRSPGAMG